MCWNPFVSLQNMHVRDRATITRGLKDQRKSVNMSIAYLKTLYSKAILMWEWGVGGGGQGDVCRFHTGTDDAAHITMNASLSHYLYIMATTPRRGQASPRLINPLTAQPKEKWGARQRRYPLIHRLYLTPRPGEPAKHAMCLLSYRKKHF